MKQKAIEVTVEIMTVAIQGNSLDFAPQLTPVWDNPGLGCATASLFCAIAHFSLLASLSSCPKAYCSVIYSVFL